MTKISKITKFVQEPSRFYTDTLCLHSRCVKLLENLLSSYIRVSFHPLGGAERTVNWSITVLEISTPHQWKQRKRSGA